MKFIDTLIIALNVAAVKERATARYNVKNFTAVCTSSSSCFYSFDALIGTGTSNSSSSCSITVPASDGKLPDIAKYNDTCAGMEFWFRRTSIGLEFWNSIRVRYSSYLGYYLIPASNLTTSGGVEHYAGPTSFILFSS